MGTKAQRSYFFIIYLLKMLFIFRKRGGREGDREGKKNIDVRETLTGCLVYAPNWGPGL